MKSIRNSYYVVRAWTGKREVTLYCHLPKKSQVKALETVLLGKYHTIDITWIDPNFTEYTRKLVDKLEKALKPA